MKNLKKKFVVQVKLVAPSLMPKLGKAGSLQSRQAIVHSLVHTESWAIDLSWVLPFFASHNWFNCLVFVLFCIVYGGKLKILVLPCNIVIFIVKSLQDIIARFGKQEAMPREFFTDFVKVAQDEGRHFTLLAKRLEELGSSYGALPAHDGLWDSAIATSKDLLARLAIEHCVHEVCAYGFNPFSVLFS